MSRRVWMALALAGGLVAACSSHENDNAAATARVAAYLAEPRDISLDAEQKTHSQTALFRSDEIDGAAIGTWIVFPRAGALEELRAAGVTSVRFEPESMGHLIGRHAAELVTLERAELAALLVNENATICGDRKVHGAGQVSITTADGTRQEPVMFSLGRRVGALAGLDPALFGTQLPAALPQTTPDMAMSTPKYDMAI